VLSEEEIVRVKRIRAGKEPQHRGAMLPPQQRGGFDLIEATLTEEAALGEAARCMQCSSFCDKCVEVCPNRANYTFTVSPVSLTLPRLSCQQGRLTVTGEEVFQVAQTRQIIHVDDFCNECGNCTTFCVHDGKPYLDKPRLYLDKGDFEQEHDNALHIERGEQGWVIGRREGGQESWLSLESDVGDMSFENDWLEMSLSPDFRISGLELRAEFEGAFSLTAAATMAVILKGVITSLPFLLV
jgi:putative selenate reductase